jgi:hypothetical protein
MHSPVSAVRGQRWLSTYHDLPTARDANNQEEHRSTPIVAAALTTFIVLGCGANEPNSQP